MSARRSLPASGSVSLKELTEALGNVPTLLGIPDRVALRVVAVPAAGGSWAPVAASVSVGDDTLADDCKIVEAGDLRLVAVRTTTEELRSPNELRAFLRVWRAFVHDQTPDGEYQDTVNISRHWSNERGRFPCWICNLYGEAGSVPEPSLPSGPFFSQKDKFFALGLADAAARWLGWPKLRDVNGLTSNVEFNIPDPRAYVEAIAPSVGGFTVRLEIPRAGDYTCAVTGRDYEGGHHTIIEVITEGSVSITLPVPMRSIEGYVLDVSGFPYDRFFENERQHSHALPVLYPERGAPYAELRDALDLGEDENTEFKEFLPIERARDKAVELLKAVCAFANSAGGTLYVGVSRDLRVVGVDKALYRDSSREKGDLRELRNAYAAGLQRIAREGISPQVRFEVEWITHAGISVLRMHVPMSSARPHHIVESNDVFVRRGANNKRATGQDLMLLFQRDETRRKLGL